MSSSIWIEKDVPAEPKRIIICCDGTWQSATSLDKTKGCSSNVTRLTRVLANAGRDASGKVWQQTVYYDAGIGTGDLTESEKRRQGGLGKGLVENILEAYNFIANNYNPGDQLFFFGFSRGAYTVRATAGLVCQLGVLMPSNMPAFIKHYAGYMALEGTNPGPLSEYKPWVDYIASNPNHAKTLQKDVKIQVIGVWDTVGSLGVPDLGHFWTLRKADRRVYEFFDTDLNEKILHAYQALALDEQRKAFAPAIWKLPPAMARADPKKESTTKLIQCWFPGVHINVGGGSSSNAEDDEGKNAGVSDREQLASVTFAWMCDRIRPHLALSEDALDAQIADFKQIAARPDPNFQYSVSSVASATTAWAKSWIWDPPKQFLKPGYALGPIEDSHTMTYDVMSRPEARAPGITNSYDVEKVNKKGEKTTETQETENYTHEYIHPSVWYRDEAYRVHEGTGYTPDSLKEWERVPGKERGWKWVKKGESKNMQEFEILDLGVKADGKPVSMESRLIAESQYIKPIHEKSMRAWQTKLRV